MALPTQPYKGARDFYPEDKRLQKYLFAKLRQVVESFGYHEYDAPILEPFDIYAAKSGQELVDEQLYSFEDKGGRKVALRPEMTPTVSRMVAGRRQELAYPLRWYSIPSLWRYERPQKGRLREHYQLNVDLFGIAGVEADHEVILVADQILQAFGAKRDMYTIRLNSRLLINEILSDFIDGSDEQILAVIHLIDHKAKMPHPEFLDGLSKLVTGGKHHELVEILSVKSLGDLPDKYRKHPSVEQLSKLKTLLNESHTTNVVDDLSLMRGFDYYTDVVFEIFDTHPDNNRSMFGGGRYDGLVAQFGVEPVPTVGFGMGDVTLQNFLETHELMPRLATETDAVVILIGEVYEPAQRFLSNFRKEGLRLAVDSSGRKLDSQIKSAAKAGVRYVLFIGEEELADERFRLKNLTSGEEQELSFERVVSALAPQHDAVEEL